MSSDSSDSEEERAKRNIKERDEFANRLKAKDESKVRKITLSAGSGAAEAAKRIKLADDKARDKLIPKFRVESRRQYLEKRKEEKVQELEADIHEDEYLFEESILTKTELKEREHKKQLLQLAKEHEQARELERIQRYRMPSQDDKVEPEEEISNKEPLQSEQNKWESDQISSTVYKFGAKDNRNGKLVQLQKLKV